MITLYLETERLILRPIKMTDASDYFEFASLPNVGPRAGWKPHNSLKETKEVIGSMIKYKPITEPGFFAVVLKESQKMIGTIELYNFQGGFKAELGYTINPKYQNQGYATEACQKMIDFGFNHFQLKRIETRTYVDNFASIKVCEKVGMKKEGIERNTYQSYDGKICDELVLSITQEDYLKEVNKFYQ